MENKELTYSEAIAEIEKIIARLRSEQTEVVSHYEHITHT